MKKKMKTTYKNKGRNSKNRNKSTYVESVEPISKNELKIEKWKQGTARNDRNKTYRENVKEQKASVKKTAIRYGAGGSVGVSATQQPGDTIVYTDKAKNKDATIEDDQQQGGIGGSGEGSSPINGPGDSDFYY